MQQAMPNPDSGTAATGTPPAGSAASSAGSGSSSRRNGYDEASQRRRDTAKPATGTATPRTTPTGTTGAAKPKPAGATAANSTGAVKRSRPVPPALRVPAAQTPTTPPNKVRVVNNDDNSTPAPKQTKPPADSAASRSTGNAAGHGSRRRNEHPSHAIPRQRDLARAGLGLRVRLARDYLHPAGRDPHPDLHPGHHSDRSASCRSSTCRSW